MSLEEIRRDWTRLGAAEPLWAVCVNPAKRGGGWDDSEFLASGAAEVDAALDRLTGLGWSAPAGGRALDFGCGAGRLTQALARHFAEVVGVDIAEPMLAEARRLNRADERVSFQLNDSPDLAGLPAASFDLLYTDLVLQHMPKALARGYLAEFTRVVRPGGAMVVGVPARERPTFKGLVFRYAPYAAIRWAQRCLLGYPAPMRMHTLPPAELKEILAPRGGRVLASDEYWAGDHWQHLRHYIVLHSSGERS